MMNRRDFYSLPVGRRTRSRTNQLSDYILFGRRAPSPPPPSNRVLHEYFSDFEEVPVRKRKRGRTKGSGRRQRNGDLDIKEIDEDEFLGGKRRTKSKMEHSGSSPAIGKKNAQKGNGIEEVDFEEYIDEMSKLGSSSKEESVEGYSAGSSRKDVSNDTNHERPHEGSSFVQRGNNIVIEEIDSDEFHDDESDSSDKPISSEPRSESSSDNASTYLPDDEISSDGANHETRPKNGSTKEPEEDGNLGSPLNDKAGDVRNKTLIDVPARKREDCSKQQDSVAKRAPNRRHQNLQNKESNCEQLTSQSRKFSSRKKQLNNEASTKQREGRNNGVNDSYSHSNDDHNYNDDIVDEVEEEEEEKPNRRQQVFSNQYDFCSSLAEAVLEDTPVFETRGNYEEAMQAPPSQTETSLPLKFRFEDEEPEEVEKTGYEKEMEDLYSEFEICCALAELGSSNCPEVDEENEILPAEETHHDRCTRGKHELILQDDEGLICIYCHHVALETKHILPDWAKTTCLSRKRCKEAEESEFNGLHFQPTANNAAGFDNSAADGTVWSLKAGIRESMYEHQREGFEFLWKNLAGSIKLDEVKSTDSREVGGCIISHAPGTGKTRLTINFIETYLKMFPNCLPVVIGPASMLLTWEEEFRKWNVSFPFFNLNNQESVEPEVKVALKKIRGVNRRNQDAGRMIKIAVWSRGRSILGISYNLFEKLTCEKDLRKKKNKGKEALDEKKQKMRRILLEKPGLVVLDEGHTPRNKTSNIWNALLKLKTEKRVILSGTPFQNNFGELFNTLRIVRPAIADVAERIASRSWYEKGNHSQASLDKLRGVMVPFVHVHKGTILQQSLPGLRDCVIFLKPSALQKSLIDRLEGSSTLEFEHRAALISVHSYLLVHVPKEQRTGIDMAAIEKSRMDPNEGVKIKFILELVRLSMIFNEKVLIFSQFVHPLELVKEHLKERFNWTDGKEILHMKGRLFQKQRQVLINAFNDPKNESKIMLGSTKCCSEGISLIGASRVVLLDVVWNPSVERQAISRAYRIGQKKFVYTYHLMTSGTTEADKYCSQAEKERLSELVFTSSSDEGKNQKRSIEDRILEVMVSREQLKGMFDKIINQPKDTDLSLTFGPN